MTRRDQDNSGGEYGEYGFMIGGGGLDFPGLLIGTVHGGERGEMGGVGVVTTSFRMLKKLQCAYAEGFVVVEKNVETKKDCFTGEFEDLGRRTGGARAIVHPVVSKQDMEHRCSYPVYFKGKTADFWFGASPRFCTNLVLRVIRLTAPNPGGYSAQACTVGVCTDWRKVFGGWLVPLD